MMTIREAIALARKFIPNGRSYIDGRIDRDNRDVALGLLADALEALTIEVDNIRKLVDRGPK